MHSLQHPHPRALRPKPSEPYPRSSPSTHRIARAHRPHPRDRQRPPHAHTRNPRAHDASQKHYNTYVTKFIAFDFSRDALVVKQPQLVVIVDLDLLLSTRRRVRNVELRCDAHTHTKARSVRRTYTPPSIHAHPRVSTSRQRRRRPAIPSVVGFSAHASLASPRALPPRAIVAHRARRTHAIQQYASRIKPLRRESSRVRRTFMVELERRFKRSMGRRAARLVNVRRH